MIFNADGSWTLHQWEDIEAIIEANKRDYNDGTKGYTASRDLRHIARIWPTEQVKMIKQYGADPFAPGNEDLLDRVLDDPDWRFLRCAPGTVTKKRLYRSPTVFKEVAVANPVVLV